MNHLQREKKNVTVMIQLYCRRNHHQRTLCESCAALLLYAERRIDGCKFGMEKPNCLDCTVHCYNKEKREEIRTVMRFAGPRMMVYHPLIAIRHLLRSKKKDAL